LSRNSVEKYKEISQRLIVILKDIDVRKIDGHTIMELKQYLNSKELSASRKNHYLVVVKNLLKYLAEEE
jgi:site-specific recombinase XerD